MSRTRTKIAKGEFSVTTPNTWNSLQNDTHTNSCPPSLRRQLKTLFQPCVNLTVFIHCIRTTKAQYKSYYAMQCYVMFIAVKAKKVKAVYSASWEPISELRSVTCYMGSHSVTCHPTQVNVPRINCSQLPARPVLDLPTPDSPEG